MPSRRFLPSTSQLSAFEAAARLGSFTRAGGELDLTQSAVSRQIRALEDQLGVALFDRDRQNVRLTPQGESYAREIRAALAKIGNASLNLSTNPRGGALNLAILPAFGTRWLAPRLGRFLNRHPGVTVNLSTRLRRFDFDAEQIDAAIDFGRSPWPGAQAAYLMAETVIPCGAPALLERLDFKTPADLLGAPLLHIATRPRAWHRWFAAQGIQQAPPRGMVFDQFATMAQAAVHGVGLTLLPDFLAEEDLNEGRLCAAFEARVASLGAYRLVWPATRASYPPLVAFRDWIVAEIASDQARKGEPDNTTGD